MKHNLKIRRAILAIIPVITLIIGLNANAAQDVLSISALVKNIKIFIGSSEYNIVDSNGKDIKVLSEGGVTYAPVRAIGEALGKDVIWDGEKNSIVLKDTNMVGEFFSFDDLRKTKFPLIAAIPEKNIQLYGINPRGTVLYNDGVGQPFDWDYLTPRGILPQIASGDYNNDGVDDIGVSLYWGSGTGISIEQLHILESSKDKYGDNYFIDRKFAESDYLKQLKEIIQHKYNPKDNTLTLQVNDKTYQYPCEGDFSEIHYSAIIDFEFENDTIKGIFHLGIGYKNSYVYEYELGALVADVILEKGEFVLINPQICDDYDFPM